MREAAVASSCRGHVKAAFAPELAGLTLERPRRHLLLPLTRPSHVPAPLRMLTRGFFGPT